MRSPKRVPVDPNELNIGVRLYQKGVKILEEKDRFCKETKEQIEKKVDESLVFRPILVTKKRDKSSGKTGVRKEEELI